MKCRTFAVVAMAAMFTACGGGSTSMPPAAPTPPPPVLPVRISTDTFTDPLGQHDTEVEPSAATHNRIIVAAFQVARQFVAGGSAIGVSTSANGGVSWSSTTLPGLTKITGGGADSASDAVVAYDGAHREWLISSVPIFKGNVPYPEVSRSSDAIVWDQPVRVGRGDLDDDKEWIACDNIASSPHFGHCYVTWDDAGRNGLIEMSTSVDGGATWSVPVASADAATGIGAQAVPLPNGDVAIVSDDFNEGSVLAIPSHDGATLGASIPISSIIDHAQAGNLRSGALVTTAVDASGTIYAAWQDCRFEARCAADDLALSTSVDGRHWTAPQRLPLDAIGSGVDHFIPGLAADAASGATAAHIGVAYYSYADALCGASCALSINYASSPDGGKTWTAPVSPGNAMDTTWLAKTNEGRMAADYVASVFMLGAPVAVYTQAFTPAGLLNEATYAWLPAVVLADARRTSVGDRPVLGARSDHPKRHFIPAR